MAAFTGTPVKSVEYTNQTASATKAAVDVISKMHAARFSYTHTSTEGSGTGEVNLIELPAGRITIYSDLSRIITSAFGANADLHLGYRAYTNSAGTAVVEDDNAFLDNADAGGGALDQAWTLPAGGYTSFDTRNGLIIYAMIDTGDIEAADTISGWVAYTRG